MTNEALTSNSKQPQSNGRIFDNMQENIKKILSWKIPAVEGHEETENNYLTEFADMIKKIEDLKSAPLSGHDKEFLTCMEQYYYIVAQKKTLPEEQYKTYLRNTRDNLGRFFLKCVLRNDYDIRNNPLKIPVSEILSVCKFIGGRFQDDHENINRVEYFSAYESGAKLRFVDLIEQTKKDISGFEKSKMNIPLFLEIFDLKDEISPDVFSYILFDHLGYTKQELSNIQDIYLK